MTEVDEQGFVKDIKVAVDAISQENKSLREKIKEILELPYSVQDVIDIESYVNGITQGQVDVGDEIYQLAIINEQLNGFDVVFKSKLEERHKELVEALMNGMEGVFKMYDVNNEVENVQPVSSVVEQPVQTPQLTDYSPETQVAEVTTPAATLDAPEMFTPVPDPTAYIEPVTFGELPQMDTPVQTTESELPHVISGLTVSEEETKANDGVPSFQDFMNNTDFSSVVSEKEEETKEDGVLSFQDFINNTDFSELEKEFTPVATEEPEEKEEIKVSEEDVQSFDNFVKSLPEEPVAEATPEVEYEVPEATEEVQVEATSDDEDEKVREISERYDRLKILEIKVYKNQKRLAKLEQEKAEVQSEISDDQNEIASLRAA